MIARQITESVHYLVAGFEPVGDRPKGRSLGPTANGSMLLQWLRVLIIAYGVLKFGLRLIEWKTTEVVVTNTRVVVKTGLISRRTKEINVSRIESVNVDQSVLGRTFGYGTGHCSRHRRWHRSPCLRRQAVDAPRPAAGRAPHGRRDGVPLSNLVRAPPEALPGPRQLQLRGAVCRPIPRRHSDLPGKHHLSSHEWPFLSQDIPSVYEFDNGRVLMADSAPTSPRTCIRQ